MKITVDRLDNFLTEVHFQPATIAADNNMFKVNNKDTRTTRSTLSIVNFEKINAGWDVECNI